MGTEKVTARRITAEETSGLDLQDSIFVLAGMDGVSPDCYARAFLTKPGRNFEGGSFTVRTVFGDEIHIFPDNAEEGGVWIAEKAGEEIEVLQSAGVLLNLALFVPGEARSLWNRSIPLPGTRSEQGSSSVGARKSSKYRTPRLTCTRSRPGDGRTRTARTATAAPWTSTRLESGSWSPARAGSSSWNRTRRSSTRHRRSDLTAG